MDFTLSEIETMIGWYYVVEGRDFYIDEHDKSALAKLEAERDRLKNLELRKVCPHNNVQKGADWELEQTIVNVNDYREIRERRITCLDCGHAWNEQTYADSDEPWPYDQGERG